MTSLAEIRAKFPQYSDLSDDQLASGLHRKFYADMPRAEFDQRIGFTNAAERGADEGMDRIKAGIPGYEGTRAILQANDTAQDQRVEARKKKFLESRSAADRVGGVASFVGDMPVRMATQGQYGVADILSGMGSESAAATVRKSQQDFARANPGLIRGLGAVGEVAAAFPPFAFAGYPLTSGVGAQVGQAARALKAAEAADDVAAFERQGITPFGPSFMNRHGQSTALALGDSIVGGPIRRAAENTLMDVAQLSEQIASRYGRATGSEEGGRAVRGGLERYRDARGEFPQGVQPSAVPAQNRAAIIAAPTRETSMKTKQGALYERAWEFLPQNMRAGRSVQGLPRIMVQFPRTRELLGEIQARNNRMIVGRDSQAPLIETGGFTSQILQSLANSRYNASLQTARDIRSNIRRMLSSLPQNERNALRSGDMRRIESRLTQDIIEGLRGYQTRANQAGMVQLGTDIGRSIHAFRRADQYTRASFARLDRVEKLFNAKDDASLYRGIINAARQGDLTKLRSMRMILRRDELDELSGSILRQMGTPIASAKGIQNDVGFSMETFATNWSKLGRDHPRARDLLFSNPQHRQAIDDLARIAQRVADAEEMRNRSNSGIAAMNVGTVGGLGASVGAGSALGFGSVESLLAGAALGGGVSILLSRPEWARWAANYAALREQIGRNPAAQTALQAHIAQLGALAAKDTALADVYQNVLKANGGAE